MGNETTEGQVSPQERGAHTPGPWKAIYSVGEWIIKCARGKYIGGLMIGGRECQANASLIAAAPDLLAALIEVQNNAASDSIAMWTRVNAAIAKATGTQP